MTFFACYLVAAAFLMQLLLSDSFGSKTSNTFVEWAGPPTFWRTGLVLLFGPFVVAYVLYRHTKTQLRVLYRTVRVDERRSHYYELEKGTRVLGWRRWRRVRLACGTPRRFPYESAALACMNELVNEELDRRHRRKRHRGDVYGTALG